MELETGIWLPKGGMPVLETGIPAIGVRRKYCPCIRDRISSAGETPKGGMPVLE